jgi:hypothetical protein
VKWLRRHDVHREPKIEHVVPLPDATGIEGVYLLVEFDTTEQAEELAGIVARYRRDYTDR